MEINIKHPECGKMLKVTVESEEAQKMLLTTDSNLQLILDYNNFQIYEDLSTKRYFYIECCENDVRDLFEVECCARLIYDINHDIKIHEEKAGEKLFELFDCDICGEMVDDNNIQYLWFKRI